METNVEEKIKDICKEYLCWNNPGAVTVKKLGKGCSNDIMVATHVLEDCQIERVLVRMYGDVIKERVTQDTYINCYMGAMGRGPKILGLFEGGRLEDFIDSETMTRERFSDDYETIIKIVAEVHNTEMPLSRSSSLENDLRRMRQLVDADNWKSEVDWYLGVLEDLTPFMPRLTFCHNDVNMLNFLVPHNGCHDKTRASRYSMSRDNPILIDWEFAGYNHPLFDIANYCCEMQFDWSATEPPYFVFNEDWLPADTKLLAMLQLYKSLVTAPIDTPDDILLSQLKFMIIGSALLWTLWALTMNTSFNLDMEEYCNAKMQSYHRKKAKYGSDLRILISLIEDKSKS